MSSAVQANKTESKGVVFARRLASTVVLLGIVFYGLLAGDTLSVFLVGGIVMLLNIIGLLEFYGMVEESSLPRFKWLGLTGGIVLVGTMFLYLHPSLAKRQFGEPTLSGATEIEIGTLAVLLLALLLRRVSVHPAASSFAEPLSPPASDGARELGAGIAKNAGTVIGPGG